MKFFKLFLGVTAAAMFAACSNDELTGLESAENAAGDAYAWNADGTGFLKIGVNLPTGTSGAKYGKQKTIGGSGSNYGEYNDGTASEYAVENAIIVIFSGEGEDESAYKIQSAYQLGSGNWNMNDTNIQITSHRTFVQQINNAGATGKLYAYAILNKHSFFEVKNEKLYFNTTDDLTGTTLADFMKLEINETGRRYDSGCFLMTNMPYASKAGAGSNPSGAVVKTLYPIDASAVYPSQTEAELGEAAAEVNVERVLAKVETTWTYNVNGVASDHFETEDGNAYHANILGWFIDNTNKTTYVARNYNAPDGVDLGYLSYRSVHQTNPTYRFVAGAPVTDGAYRTFWAIDPNYNVKAEGADALLNEGGKFVDNTIMKYNASGERVSGRLRDKGTVYYCTENTFDVAHQSHFNTTRVVVAADFGDDFFTIASEAGVKYSDTAIKDYIKAELAKRVHFQNWVGHYLKSSVDGVQFFQVNVNNLDSEGNTKAGRATVTVTNSPVGLTNDHLQEGKTLQDAIDAWKANVEGTDGDNTYIANNFKVDFYKDGVSYYSALIQHFGAEETPWDAAWYAGKENTVEGVYSHIPAQAGKLDSESYLGRYGVVRNNWYKIDVEGIRRIGSAVVPELKGTDPDTPDDQIENYIKVNINITPWVIRKQSVKL